MQGSKYLECKISDYPLKPAASSWTYLFYLYISTKNEVKICLRNEDISIQVLFIGESLRIDSYLLEQSTFLCAAEINAYLGSACTY